MNTDVYHHNNKIMNTICHDNVLELLKQKLNKSRDLV